MNLRSILFFLIFSALYCFLFIDRTFYNLSGDNLNIGTVVYHLLYPENFSGDFASITKGSYYLPIFINSCIFIQKITNNYILTLQIILFFQLFFTLLTTSYMVKVIFKIAYGIKNILLTLLLCMTLVFLPSGEMIGFGTLLTAIPRYTMGIFIPLIIVLYYKFEEISILGKGLPIIILLGAVFGILINIHPPSAVTMYLLILIHWFFYRSGISLQFRGEILSVFKKVFYSVLIFSILSMIYAIPYVKYYYFPDNKNIESNTLVIQKLISDPEEQTEVKEEEVLTGSDNFFSNLVNFEIITSFDRDTKLFYLRQWFFLPFILPFIIFIFILSGKKIKDFPEIEEFKFLRSLFIVGFITMAIGVFISVTFQFGPYLNAFRRTDRILFYIFELLCIYLIVYGKDMIEKKWMRYLICTGVLFHWLFLLKSKGLFQYDIFLSHVPFISRVDLGERALAINIMTVVLIIVLIFFRRIKLIGENMFKNAACIIIIGILFLWPLLSGGPILMANHILTSFNGLGAWTIIGKSGLSKGYLRIDEFEEACKWIRENTDKNAKVMFISEEKAHNMKILCKRPGIGTMEEIGMESVIDCEVKNLYVSNNFYENIVKLANEYEMEYILMDNKYEVDKLGKENKFKTEYSGKYYSVLKIIKESINEKI